MKGAGKCGRCPDLAQVPKTGCRAGRAASRGHRRTGHVAGVGSRSQTPSLRDTLTHPLHCRLPDPERNEAQRASVGRWAERAAGLGVLVLPPG